MTASEVLSPDNLPRFVPGQGAVPSFGFTSAAVWVLIELKAEMPARWLLEVEEPLLHSVELYGPVSGSLPGSRRAAGRLIPFSTREIQHRKILFALNLSPDPQRFLLRISSRDNVVVPLRIWKEDEFTLSEFSEQLRIGLFYGSILALVLYNFFIWISLRDSNYLYYILYALSFAGLQSANEGLFFQLFQIDSAWWNWRVPMFSGLSAGLGLLLFTGGMLQVDRFRGVMQTIRLGLIVSIAALLILSFSDVTMPFASHYANIISAITIVYAFSHSIASAAQGYRPARLFLIGWLGLLSGVFLASLVNLGILPHNAFTKSWVKAGFVAEVLLFSFALADRIRQLRREKELMDAAMLVSQRERATELERTVQERTAELQVANATKDRFFSIIAHDLRGPIGSMAMLFEQALGRDETPGLETVAALRDAARTTNGLLEDLLTWARTQLGQITPNPSVVSTEAVICDCFELLRSQADAKNIRLESHGSALVFADRSMITFVLRNLLTNAIKFTEDGGLAAVHVSHDQDRVRIVVADTGRGIRPGTKESLFRIDTRTASTPGTRNERGSGLGLILCKEFVERSGGEIGVESEPGAGSRFWFTLPPAK